MIRGTLAAVLAAGLAGCAAEQGGGGDAPPPPADSFYLVDADRDDVVTRVEWDAHGDRLHAALDTDGDGHLSADELRAGHDRLDIDGDGVLRPDEVDAAALDLDGDGAVSVSEWENVQIHEALDGDRDGRISHDEFRSHRGRHFEAYGAADLHRRGLGAAARTAPRGFAPIRF